MDNFNVVRLDLNKIAYAVKGNMLNIELMDVQSVDAIPLQFDEGTMRWFLDNDIPERVLDAAWRGAMEALRKELLMEALKAAMK